MPLPHYTQAKASIQKFETIQPNLFEVTLLPPAGIGFDTGLILQHVSKISGLDAINPAIEAIAQKYKFADRSYAGMPDNTYVDLDLDFTVNLNDANEAYLYKSMQDWYKLIYDPATGEMGLKKDYVGTIIVLQYNRAGDVFRKITFKDAFPTGNPTFTDELNYETQDAAAVNMKYRSDYWIEELV